MLILNKIINSLIRRGNKQRAENLVLWSLKKIKKESKKSLIYILKQMFRNATFIVELKAAFEKA